MDSGNLGMDGFISSGNWSPNSSSYFPDAFADMASLQMPATVQYALRWCFPPGTFIELADGTLRTIENIAPGDVILTRERSHKPVVAKGCREFVGNLVNLKFAGMGKNLPLRTTPNHKLEVIRNGDTLEIRADEVLVGDVVRTPTVKIEANKQIPRFSGWLLGMYIAEGNVIRNGENLQAVRFTCSDSDERNGILKKLQTELNDQTGDNLAFYIPPSRPELRLFTSHDVELPDWVYAHAPGLAPQKELTAAIFNASADFKLQCIAGWLDGDGSLKIRDGITFSGISGFTSSKKLARQFQRLAQTIGLCPALAKHGQRENSYILTFNCRDAAVLKAHSIKLSKINIDVTYRSVSRKHKLVDNYIFRKVTEITQESYSGPVYNLEIKDDHSYIADGIAVSNCEFLMFANGTYFRALDRVLSYFITSIELSNCKDDDEKEHIKDILHDPEGLDILDDIHTGGLNYMVYGNDFSTLVIPFRRYLSCPQCGLELPLKKVYETADFKFKWHDFEFHASCPKCKYSGQWKHIDRRRDDIKKMRMRHWSPHDIELLWCPYSDDVDYIWKIPEDTRKTIKDGKLFHLERAPAELIKCVKNNSHMLFEKDVIFHMKENTLAGIRNRGWGISRVLSNFRQAWYVQVLHRYNEAIALDYVIPFRVITPAQGPGSGDIAKDALMNLNMGGYMSQIQNMLKLRRRDPARWNTLPFAVDYKALGGDATQLAPRDLLDQGLEVLLNNVGVPVELYKGSLQIQSAPAALRLFEASWSHLVHNLNGYLAYVIKRLCQVMNWNNVTAKLEKVTHADDLQRNMAKLQLMMGGQTSKQTGLQSVGANYFDEVRRQIEEQKFEAEMQNKLQKDLENSATMDQMQAPPQQGQMGGDPSMGGGAGGMPGGAPADPSQGAGGGMPQGSADVMASQPTLMNKPTTPQEMISKASTMAQQFISMPESQKDSQLIQLKKTDPTLHALVNQQMEEMRRKAQNVGGAMVMAQQTGKQAAINGSVMRGPFNTLPFLEQE